MRNALRAFEQEGLGCLQQKSCRPKSARKLLDHVVHAVDTFVGRQEQVDDLTLVVLRCEQPDIPV